MKHLMSVVIFFSMIATANAQDVDSPEMTGDVDYYLIIGSFRSKHRAENAIAMFSDGGIDRLAIQIAQVFGETWHRVAHGPFDVLSSVLRSKFVDMGVHDAWWIQHDKFTSAAGMMPKKAPGSAAAVTVATSNQTSIKQSRVVPPRAGESYLGYCARKANATERALYCDDGDFSSLGAMQMISATLAQVQRGIGDSPEQQKSLVAFCLLRATAQQRTRYCN